MVTPHYHPYRRSPNIFGIRNENISTPITPNAPMRPMRIHHQDYSLINPRELDFKKMDNQVEISNLYGNVVSVMKSTGICLHTSPDESESESESKSKCSICNDTIKFNNGGKLPCGHMFHEQCIVDWFSKMDFICTKCKVSVNVLELLK
jgi:hypothetical protein